MRYTYYMTKRSIESLMLQIASCTLTRTDAMLYDLVVCCTLCWPDAIETQTNDTKEQNCW